MHQRAFQAYPDEPDSFQIECSGLFKLPHTFLDFSSVRHWSSWDQVSDPLEVKLAFRPINDNYGAQRFRPAIVS